MSGVWSSFQGSLLLETWLARNYTISASGSQVWPPSAAPWHSGASRQFHAGRRDESVPVQLLRRPDEGMHLRPLDETRDEERRGKSEERAIGRAVIGGECARLPHCITNLRVEQASPYNCLSALWRLGVAGA